MMFDQVYLAQSFLVTCAMLAVLLGAKRLQVELIRGNCDELLQTSDALMMPLTGSAVLLTMYLILRYVSPKLLSLFVSLFLGTVSIFVLGMFLKKYIRPSILTGLFCTSVGLYYMFTRNWIANNFLAFAFAVVAIESIPIDTFKTSFALLVGLFFYDIFWVFGTEVMVTVARGINAPIKFTFPQTIWGNHEKQSLIGLGDIIVPGIFIAQTLVFSQECVKRGNFYFKVSMIAYMLSLINTVTVMLIFKHGQPALLFIVPWLLLSFMIAACYKGDLHAAWKFDTSSLQMGIKQTCKQSIGPTVSSTSSTNADKNGFNKSEASETSVNAESKESAAKQRSKGTKNKKVDDESFINFAIESIQHLFGFNLPAEDRHSHRVRVPAPRKGAKGSKTLQSIMSLVEENKRESESTEDLK